MLTDWGLKQSQIKVVSVLGSRQGVEHLADEFPDVEVGFLSVWSEAGAHEDQIFIGAVDDHLTEKGYISPGLGDAVRHYPNVEEKLLIVDRATGCSVPTINENAWS